MRSLLPTTWHWSVSLGRAVRAWRTSRNMTQKWSSNFWKKSKWTRWSCNVPCSKCQMTTSLSLRPKYSIRRKATAKLASTTSCKTQMRSRGTRARPRRLRAETKSQRAPCKNRRVWLTCLSISTVGRQIPQQPQTTKSCTRTQSWHRSKRRISARKPARKESETKYRLISLLTLAFQVCPTLESTSMALCSLFSVITLIKHSRSHASRLPPAIDLSTLAVRCCNRPSNLIS